MSNERRPERANNVFSSCSSAADGECFDALLTRPGCRIERIVSHGQARPPGFWYEQDWDEWVLLLAGEAVLGFEGVPAGRYWQMNLHVGDHVFIPKGQRHRVEFTDPTAETIWLAVHVALRQGSGPYP